MNEIPCMALTQAALLVVIVMLAERYAQAERASTNAIALEYSRQSVQAISAAPPLSLASGSSPTFQWAGVPPSARADPRSHFRILQWDPLQLPSYLIVQLLLARKSA